MFGRVNSVDLISAVFDWRYLSPRTCQTHHILLQSAPVINVTVGLCNCHTETARLPNLSTL